MSLLLEKPLLREAVRLADEGTETADPIAAFAASQLKVVRGLPAETLLAPIEAEVDDESDEDEAKAREEGPAATSDEADDGTSPGDYSAQHALASGRLHAARAEAAALSQASPQPSRAERGVARSLRRPRRRRSTCCEAGGTSFRLPSRRLRRRSGRRRTNRRCSCGGPGRSSEARRAH